MRVSNHPMVLVFCNTHQGKTGEHNNCAWRIYDPLKAVYGDKTRVMPGQPTTA